MDDEAPIPSLPILTEEETLKQLQDDFTKGYRQKIAEQQQKISSLQTQIHGLREALQWQLENCPKKDFPKQDCNCLRCARIKEALSQTPDSPTESNQCRCFSDES